MKDTLAACASQFFISVMKSLICLIRREALSVLQTPGGVIDEQAVREVSTSCATRPPLSLDWGLWTDFSSCLALGKALPFTLDAGWVIADNTMRRGGGATMSTLTLTGAASCLSM